MGFIFCCGVSLAFYYLFIPMVTNEKGYIYYVRPAVSKHVVIAELAQLGIIKHPTILTLFTYNQKNLLKIGEYQFKKGASLYQIWKQMISGKGLYYRHFTLIPGWTFKQLRMELDKAFGLRHTIDTLNDQTIMEKLGQGNLPPEGQFFPETYNYTRGNADFVILKRAFNLMKSKLDAEWESRDSGLPYKNSYEALIVASMIEKEAYLDNERPKIAGVLMNRLLNNMLLQIDATVIYGLGEEYSGKIYKENLLKDSPYNTYLHRGLPPTPIAMPGLSSIKAATHPEKNDYYYYVAKSDGSHEFSSTLEKHHAAIEANKTAK